jgi:hypothetical protein
MWWRSPTSLMLAPRSGCTVRCVTISMPKCSREVGAQFLCEHGLPQVLTFDNDPREVFSPAGRDFPSALVRFLLCLGVQPGAHPPSSTRFLPPTSSAFIVHLVRSGGLVHRPTTLSQVAEFTEAFLAHYNQERPNQARSCGNQPPRVAFPAFPTLPAVPQTVDPDRWLGAASISEPLRGPYGPGAILPSTAKTTL